MVSKGDRSRILQVNLILRFWRTKGVIRLAWADPLLKRGSERRSLHPRPERGHPFPDRRPGGNQVEPSDQRRRRSQPISRVLSRTIIHLGYASPRTSSDLPGSLYGPHVRSRSRDRSACFPIWSCSGRGLPCRRVLPPARCALTAPFHPYPATLQRDGLGGLLSVALSVDSGRPGVS